MSSAKNISVTRDEKRWEVEIKAEIPPDSLAYYRAEALKELGKTVRIAGFRQGHVPESVLVQNIGETEILRHAAEHAVQHELPEILAAEKVNIVDAPKVAVEPPQAGKALSFTARAPLAPEVKLPDYKTLAQKINTKKETVSITDEEHKGALTHFKRERARIERIESGITPEKAHEGSQALAEKDLPELDDEFVKALGYDSAALFAEKVREHMRNEKALQAKSAHRAAILDALAKDARINYPAILAEYELDEMEGRFTADLERAGQTFPGYLAETKKSREDLRKEWAEAADKRARIRLILAEIGRAEKMEPDQEKLLHEIEHARKHYPQASPDLLRSNIAHMMRNEKVLEFLESLEAAK